MRPVRSVATVGAVLALLAGVAIPAYAATTAGSGGEQPSAHELAEVNAQSLRVDGDAKAGSLDAASYAATTAEEIEEKKAAEEAKKAAAAAAASASVSSSYSDAPLPMAVDGAVCPLPPGSYTVTRSVGSGHNGADLAGNAGGNPIYAVKSGTVTLSSEGYVGYGVAVKIKHDDGTETLYGHMQYGSRTVQAGQRVEAGQVIGVVGNTGRSYGAHLHIELRINGVIVDPLNYLPI